MEVIGLCGLAGAGKSTVALRLIEEHGFERAKFAGALKAMSRTFLAYRGASPLTIERMIEGDLKEVPSPLLNGRTPRHWMIRLGTEFGRNEIDVNLWADTEVEHLQAVARDRAEPRFVFDDVRFQNEVEAIRRIGGKIWRVERDGLVVTEDAHESERLDVVADAVISNWSGLLANLFDQVDNLAPRRDYTLHPCFCAARAGNPDCRCRSDAAVCVRGSAPQPANVATSRIVIASTPTITTPDGLSAEVERAVSATLRRVMLADEVSAYPPEEGEPVTLEPRVTATDAYIAARNSDPCPSYGECRDRRHCVWPSCRATATPPRRNVVTSQQRDADCGCPDGQACEGVDALYHCPRVAR